MRSELAQTARNARRNVGRRMTLLEFPLISAARGANIVQDTAKKVDTNDIASAIGTNSGPQDRTIILTSLPMKGPSEPALGLVPDTSIFLVRKGACQTVNQSPQILQELIPCLLGILGTTVHTAAVVS